MLLTTLAGALQAPDFSYTPAVADSPAHIRLSAPSFDLSHVMLLWKHQSTDTGS